MRYLIFSCLIFVALSARLQTEGLSLTATEYTTASGVIVQAEAGTLTVPECRDNAASTAIDLTFIRLKSTSNTPLAPLVYLEGGPGSSCTWMAENPERLEDWLPILAISDVILLDQRGTGTAARRLVYMNDTPPAEDLWINAQAAENYFVEMARKAIPAWKAQGIDLSGYNSMESARDIEALRQALALNQISLLGFSYGTHLGQVYLKYHSEHVERAILAGVEGLGETYKMPLAMDAHFRKIAAMVAADPKVGADIPDLVALYREVAGKLERQPLQLTLRSPLTGKDMEVKVGKFGLDFILFMDLGDASDLPIIPRMLYQLNQGDEAAFRWFLQKRLSMGYGLHAMAVTMDLSSGASSARRAMIEQQAAESLFGKVVNVPYLALADSWPTQQLGDDFRADFTTDVPLLLLSGTLDRNTPPHQAERLRWSMPNAHHLVVQNAGHEQILTHPDVGLAIIKFLKSEDVSTLTAAYPPLEFMPVNGEVGEAQWHPALEAE